MFGPRDDNRPVSGSQRTYEELKLKPPAVAITPSTSSQRTYEELKHKVVSYISIVWLCSQRTYEELKLRGTDGRGSSLQ